MIEDRTPRIINFKPGDDRYHLTLVAAQRARDIMAGATPFIESENRACLTALQEIEQGFVDKNYLSIRVELLKKQREQASLANDLDVE